MFFKMKALVSKKFISCPKSKNFLALPDRSGKSLRIKKQELFF